jgi:nitrite reductase/ring-hydroxylating ferredoxin subunit
VCGRSSDGERAPASHAPPERAPEEPTPEPEVPEGFSRVCAADELADGEIAEFIVDDVPIALARIGDAHHAVGNTCPHAGGPLGDGLLEGTVVACPWHGWGFDVTTGVCALDPTLAVDVHPVRVEGGAVWVDVSGAAPT